MILAETRGFDWVAAWKTASIVLTGAFGVLGLFTEFKDKDTKKVTKWGYVSLVGIVLSTLLGSIAQMKESQDASGKALALAKKTDETLVDIQRGLSSISGASVRMVLRVPCDQAQYSVFCRGVRAYHQETGLFALPKAKWIGWPPFQHLDVRINLLKNSKKNQLTHIDEKEFVNLVYLLEETNPTASISAEVNEQNGVDVAIDCAPRVWINNGGIKSVLDFNDLTMLISLGELKDFVPTAFYLTTRDGEEVEPDDFPEGRFKKIGIKSKKSGDFEDYAAMFQADVQRLAQR